MAPAPALTSTSSSDYGSDNMPEPVSASEGSEDISENVVREEQQETAPDPRKVSSRGGRRLAPAQLQHLTQQPAPDSSTSSSSCSETVAASAASTVAASAPATTTTCIEEAPTKRKAPAPPEKRPPAPRLVGERRAPAPSPLVGGNFGSTACTGGSSSSEPGTVAMSNSTTTALQGRAAREAAKMNAYHTAAPGAVAVTDEKLAPMDIEQGNNAVEVRPLQQSLNTTTAEQSSGAPTTTTGDSSPDEENQQEAAPEQAVTSSAASSPEGEEEGQEAVLPSTNSPAAGQPPNTPPGVPPPDLPEAVPVAEPPALRAGTSIGSTGTSTAPGAAGSSVVQAQPLEEWGEEGEGRKTVCGNWLSPTQWAVGALLIVVLIVVGVVVGITQSKDSPEPTEGGEEIVGGGGETGSSSSTEAPSVEDTPQIITDPGSCVPFQPFSADLHFLTLQALKEPCSPQSRANSWMMQDPNLNQYGVERRLQRFALATLFFSTSGDGWEKNDLWLDYEHDECQWFNKDADGTTQVCDENSSIVHLNLARNSLNGVLPVELFFFPALANLDLSHNNLYGTAPTMFNGAKYLERLVLSSNQLTGQFTAELGFVASKLAILNNDDNMFTGAVPGLLRLLPHLSHLNITGNQYTGALPGSLIQLKDTLTSLEVANNAITGVIPTELGAATNLQVIDVGGNPQLGGTIPAEMGVLADLRTIDISGTSMSGSLPGNLCELEQDGGLTVLADCDGSFECCDD